MDLIYQHNLMKLIREKFLLSQLTHKMDIEGKWNVFDNKWWEKYFNEVVGKIDGGINIENSKTAIKAGVDIIVSGTTIFKENGGNLKKNIELLKTG